MKRFLKAALIIVKRYGIQLWIIFFAANVAVIVSIRSSAQTQPCLTQAQINADSRCLYVYNGSIYQKGSRSSPHHSHACGMDVSNILPGSHINSLTSYLVPSFVGTVCATQATPTVAPTQAPTPTPVRTPTPTACPAVPTNLGVATFTANAATAGNYTIWSRIMAATTTSNSYYLQVDNMCPISVGGTGVSLNSWTWLNYQNGNTGSTISVPLTAGSHQIKLIGKAANTKIDRLIIINNFSCVPTGLGDNCAGSSLPNPKADVNSDGMVNIIDIGIIIDNYAKTPITNPRADVNGDGIVNIVDIGVVIDNYGL